MQSCSVRTPTTLYSRVPSGRTSRPSITPGAEGTPHTEADIEAIGEQSRANNKRLDLTGTLMAFGGLFYQVLEGPAEVVDEVYD
ncbi:MAG: BLUF domain-containing protein [Acidobacteriota bacterium]